MFWRRSKPRENNENSASSASEASNQAPLIVQNEEKNQIANNSQILSQDITPDQYLLSTENFRNIPYEKYPKDFTFIVNGKKFRTSRFIADILSPVIRESHFSDATSNSFYINTHSNESDLEYDSDDQLYFKSFLNLTKFNNQETIDENHRKRFYEYFYHLGNIDECYRLQPQIFKDPTTENAIDQLLTISKLSSIHNYLPYSNNELIIFIAKNFEQIDKEKMKLLDINLLNEIFSSQSLKLRDEDSLLLFLLNLYRKDKKSACLFEHVVFLNVTKDVLCTFMNEVEFEDLNRKIWQMVCCRMLPESIRSLKYGEDPSLTTNRYIFKIKEFEHQEGNEFNGIMRFLTEKVNGNIHDHGLINITSNSITGNNNHPKNLVDYRNNNYYYSKDNGGAIVCFDFIDKLVQVSSYTIKSYQSQNSTFLKNWVIEVSNDKIHWKIIDHHENDSRLKGSNLVATFNIGGHNSNDFYRFIQLRQTGNSWCDSYNHNYISCYCMEFYGKMMYPPE